MDSYSGLTTSLTMKAFALGSDTVSQSVTATAGVNNNSSYSAPFIDLPAGEYVVVLFTGTTPVDSRNYSITLVTGEFFSVNQANVVEVSGSVASADNLELQYDGVTGLIGDNTLGAIDPSSSPFVGLIQGGTTFEDIGPGTDTFHSLNDSGNDIDIVYGFSIGGNMIGTDIRVFCDVDGGNDNMNIKVYDHVGSVWVKVANLDDNDNPNIPITQKFTGTG